MSNISSRDIVHKSMRRRVAIACLVMAAAVLHAPASLARAGDVDATFGDGGVYAYPRPPVYPSIVNYIARQIVPLSRGTLLALGDATSGPGSFATYKSSASFALTEAGILDASYGRDGVLVEPPVQTRSVVQARELVDGRVIVAAEISGCPTSPD